MRKSVRIGLLAAVALGATAVVGLFGPTAANAAPSNCGSHGQPYPVTTQAQIESSTTTPAVGEQFEASGIHYLPNEDVKIYIGGTVGVPCDPSSYSGGTFVGTGHTDASGAFDPQVTMPDLSGNQLLVGVGASGKGYDWSYMTLTIGGTGTGPGAGTGPNTGSTAPANTGVDIALMLSAAAVLIAAGVLFMRSGRRRRLASS